MKWDMEIEVETIGKSGGFIGTLWPNKSGNAIVALVQEGLATVHSYSADTLSWLKQLYTIEVCLVFCPLWGALFLNIFYIWITVDPTRFFFSGGGEGEKAQREYL